MSIKRPQRQIRWLLAGTALPGIFGTAGLLWWGEFSILLSAVVLAVVVTLSFMAGALLSGRLQFWLRTIANLVSGLREGDYSFRARSVELDDVWGELTAEVNQLADHLRGQRLDAREAAGLLRNVMAEIPVGVFTFDPQRRIRFLNRAGERILGRERETALGRTAGELGMTDCLEGGVDRTLDLNFGSTLGRWALRRTIVRQDGHPHQLIVLTDLSRTLREEERLAWQRIVRVLGHEVNNSLAPIQSIAASLEKLIALDSPPEDWQRDACEGLAVIRGRSEALSRFMRAYSGLARLPPPTFRELEVSAWISRNAALETRAEVIVQEGPSATIDADRDQLDQLLINLIRNATDAALLCADDKVADSDVSDPSVEVSWTIDAGSLVVQITDNGHGVESSENLFVPFFTTKDGGSGIGLALGRQIAEGHDGSLTLSNRKEIQGAVAEIRLPIRQPE